jgi:hypothetical protein
MHSDVPRRQQPGDTGGPDFLPEVHDRRRRRPGARPDGWIHSVPDVPGGEAPAAGVSLALI